MMLGLDIGTKRVGTALSNSGSNLATPYRTYSRESGQAEREILALIGEKKVKILVVGLPLGATGERTYQCRDIASF
ncbi:MAG: Holliday junction resolvase RuvX, partial [Proteobacteria bacterium]